jgi:hypothetical protein
MCKAELQNHTSDALQTNIEGSPRYGGLASRAPFSQLAFLCIALLVFISQASAQDTKQLRVTVIAVTEFDDAQLRNKELIDGITSATQALQLFFQAQYGVTPRVFQSHDDTTAQAIRKWLFYDLSRDSEKSIHLVFILTHGIGYQYSGSTIFKNELFLATSDTKSDDYFGIAIRGSELIDAFQRLAKGSSAFLFLDTCGSGSIDNSGISQLLQADSVSATRMMILAASMAEESAFRARFTSALLQIWRFPDPAPNDCHSGDKNIAAYVNKRMDAFQRLDPKFSQNVSVVFPYSSDFCIESFGSQSALALLANPTDEELKLAIVLNKDPRDTITLRVKAQSVEPIVLRRDAYAIDVRPVFDSSSRIPGNLSLDLSSDYVQYLSLYPGDSLTTALSQHKAALYAAEWGAPDTKVSQLVSSANQRLRAALENAVTNTAQTNRQITLLQATVAEASQKKAVLDNQLSSAEIQLESQQAAARKHSVIAQGITGAHQMSSEDQRAIQSELAAVNKLKESATAATYQLTEQQQRLSDAQNAKLVEEEKVNKINQLIKSFGAASMRATAQSQARKNLLEATRGLFPTQDTPRGLVVSVPPTRTPQQVGALGKLLASKASPMLIEIETYVSGTKNNFDNQKEAIQAAYDLRNDLVRETGILPEWTVVRGFPGPAKGQNAGTQRIEQIVISGDFIGDTPTQGN